MLKKNCVSPNHAKNITRSKLKPTTKLQTYCTQVDLSCSALFFEKMVIFKLSIFSFVSDTPVTSCKTINAYT